MCMKLIKVAFEEACETGNGDDDATELQYKRNARLFVVAIIVLGFVEPLEVLEMSPTIGAYRKESLSGLSDLLARFFVDVLFGDMRAPLLYQIFVQKIGLVKRHQDLGYCSGCKESIGVALADEPLDTTQERLLVLLGSDELMFSRYRG